MYQNRFRNLASLADSSYGRIILALVAFFEAIIFPVPPDVLLIPMALINRSLSFLLAIIVTISSVAGGCLGYFLGYLFWTELGIKLVEFWGYSDAFELFSTEYKNNGVLVILIGGLSPFPYKIVTILSGALEISFPIFVILSLISRGFRFFFIAALIYLLGEAALRYISKYSTIIFCLIILLLLLFLNLGF